MAETSSSGAPQVPSAKFAALETPLPQGHRLFEYRIERVLGQGGFGIAYAATDVNLEARVVIKEYLPETIAQRLSDGSVGPRYSYDLAAYQEGLDNFLAEARTIALFRHPSVVRVARFFEANRTAYMVLEYEEGESLRAWRNKHPEVSEAELVTLLAPLLEGLAEVHGAGYLHRDIKPDNIYVRDADDSLVLLDFGNARQVASPKREDGVTVTPGYAPIEQYNLRARQGPYTDIYALGATLLWLVGAPRPLEAPARVAGAADPQPPAHTVAKGRYSAEFLAAIDAALKRFPDERPKNVDEFRAALFAGHPGALELTAALDRAGLDDPLRQPRTKWLSLVRRPRTLFARLRGALLRPSDWPIARLIAVTMLVAALLPMAVTAYVNHKRSVASLAAAEMRNLQLLAQSTAGRLSQLLADHSRLAGFLSRQGEVVAFLRSREGERAQGAVESPRDGSKASALLSDIVASNPDLLVASILDANGVALASSAPGAVGQEHASRRHFREAFAGKPYMTSFMFAAESGQPGVSFANPIADAAGKPLGVLALTLKGSAIVEILESVRKGKPGLAPILVDEDGIVIHHADPRQRYKSLAPLAPAKRQEIALDERYGRRNVESLDMPELARQLVGAREGATAHYRSTISGKDEVAGFAPVAGHKWVVAMTENREVFEDPLQELYNRVILTLLAVGLFVIYLTRRIARRIVRPVQELTSAAHALKSADFDNATVRVTSRNEVGQLARVFNVMIDILRQRERERARKKKD